MKLTQYGNIYFINSKVIFNPKPVKPSIINKSFQFAYEMAFGEGHHRVHRTGGTEQRSTLDIFRNTLQGKIAEAVVHEKLATNGNLTPPRREEKTEAQWKNILSPEVFHVTRQHGTERPFSGEYCEAHDPGIYECICCKTPLFDSTVKFESGTGWPSFNQPIEENTIKYIMDQSYGMVRVEVQCNVCDSHLGHVFPDGPPPTGLRYCVNSASIKKQDS